MGDGTRSCFDLVKSSQLPPETSLSLIKLIASPSCTVILVPFSHCCKCLGVLKQHFQSAQFQLPTIFNSFPLLSWSREQELQAPALLRLFMCYVSLYKNNFAQVLFFLVNRDREVSGDWGDGGVMVVGVK